MSLKRIFSVSVLIIMLFVSKVHAEKWKSLNFTNDIETGLAQLEKHCVIYEIESADVLWSNNLNSIDDIKPGSVIYLPTDQAEMVAIWQHQGAWKPTALVPVTSAAAANKVKTPKKNNNSKSPARAIQQMAAQQKNNPPQISPANAIQDAVLSANNNKKKEPEIKGLMDSVIISEADGKKVKGPVRLVLSGDKVELIQMPQNFVKTPSLDDLHAPFGTPRDYLPKYTPLPKIKNNRNTQTPAQNNLNGKMLWPVVGKISSPFGCWRGNHKHAGIDIPMPAGTPIRAARSGVVEITGNNSTMGFRGYGNFVMVDHGGGMKTFYAHCQSVAVSKGQKVMQGQIVGYVGSTGRSTANHLHFEVRVNNSKVDPVPYLAGNVSLANK